MTATPPPTTYEDLGREVGALVEAKSAAYGDSFGRSGEIMRVFYPRGIAPEQMDDALAVIRIVDKLHRIANQPDAFGESPFGDIAGYGILGLRRHRERQAETRIAQVAAPEPELVPASALRLASTTDTGRSTR